MTDASPFVKSPEWLEERLGQPGLTIIDASWYLPAQNRDGHAEYQAAHVPGAVYFNQDLVVDPDASLPHTMPTEDIFARYAGTMGVSDEDTIIIYDGPGFFSAPRVWWLFRVMGAREVYLLDGGFDRWKAEGRPVTAELTKTAPCVFQADLAREKVALLDDVRGFVEAGDGQIADARPAGRFTGADPEPRAGMRSGHMPGARNMPAAELSREGRLLPPSELREKLEAAGLDLSKPIVTSCGSGVTAAVITLALESIGHTDNRLYDGSWSEWGGRSDTPVEAGPAGGGNA